MNSVNDVNGSNMLELENDSSNLLDYEIGSEKNNLVESNAL
jgi:hypothetical protein